MSLQHLTVRPGQRLSASRRDLLIRHLRRQQLTGVSFRDGTSQPFVHPWRVTARRFEAPEGGTSPLDPDATWRLDIAPGTVNDAQPSLLYRRQNDPRGWQPGDGYAGPKPGEPGYDPIFIERDLLDDLDDPPFLALKDPPRLQPATDADKLSKDFTFVADDERPNEFKGADDWEKELWCAHVILSATPLTVGIFEPSAPPKLRRYRIYSVPRLPSPTFGALAGGWVELAEVWLLRDPQAMDDVELRIRQREFWPLWAQIVTPGAELLDVLGLQVNAEAQFFADLARSQIVTELEAASSAEFWTV